MTEKRTKGRSRTLKAARILLGKAHVPCTVRNISETGACLQVQCTYGIPSSFDFQFENQAPRACKVTWIDSAKLGVQFV